MIQMKSLRRLEEMRLWQGIPAVVLQETGSVDALLAVFGCRKDKVRNECQSGQRPLDGDELGRRMVQWSDPDCGFSVIVVALIGTMLCLESNLLMVQ
jgi:hypothetical protein